MFVLPSLGLIRAESLLKICSVCFSINSTTDCCIRTAWKAMSPLAADTSVSLHLKKKKVKSEHNFKLKGFTRGSWGAQHTVTGLEPRPEPGSVRACSSGCLMWRGEPSAWWGTPESWTQSRKVVVGTQSYFRALSSALQRFTWSEGSAALWRPSGCIKASHALPGLWPLPVCINQMSKQLTNWIRRRWMHLEEQLRSEGKILFNKEAKCQVFVCCSSAEIPSFYPLSTFLWRHAAG